MKITKLLTVAGAIALLAGASTTATAQEAKFITIGTGGVTGVYYPTGGAICRLVNKDRKANKLRCSVESTGGSVYNTRTIREGELDFGIVQSDVQAAAVAGSGDFKADGAFPELRALFSIHPEPMHVMARADSGINTVNDFKGKRVNIGNPGSGQRVLAEMILKYSGVKQTDLALAGELKSSEQSAALCDGNLQAAVWAAGLPNGSTMEAASTCAIKLVPMTGPWVDKLLAENKAYSRATIPGGMYPGSAADVPSYGPKATMVTSTKTSDDVAYAVVKAVFGNFDEFKKLHPAFDKLKESEMITDGLSAKLHPGAVKYYKERGWMK